MKNKHKAVLVVMIALVSILSSCSKQQIGFALYGNEVLDSLKDEFKIKDAAIFLSSKTKKLIITLYNTEFNGLNKEAQQEKAKEIAKYIALKINPADAIPNIEIVFNKRFNLILFNFDVVCGTYSFKTQELIN